MIISKERNGIGEKMIGGPRLFCRNGRIDFGEALDDGEDSDLVLRGGATLKAGCAAAHPDFLKNQRKKFIYIYIQIILNTLRC